MVKATSLALFPIFFLGMIYTSSAQDIPCQQKHSNLQCSSRYKEDSQGKPHGTYIEYNPQGKVVRQGSFNHGIKEGSWFDSSDGALLFYGGLYQWYTHGTLIAGSYAEIHSLDEALKIKAKNDEVKIKRETIQIDGKDYRAEYRLNNWGNCYEGPYKIYYLSGKPYKVSNFVSCEQTGDYFLYYENGQLMEKGKYEYSKRTGIIERYYEDGSIDLRASFLNDKANGLWEQFYPNGKIKLRYNYSDGIENGLSECFYENGNTQCKLIYSNGVRSGLAEWFYTNGKIKSRYLYEPLYRTNDPKQPGYICKTNNCVKVLKSFYTEDGIIESKESMIEDNEELVSKEGAFELYNNGEVFYKYSYKKNKINGDFFFLTSNKKYSGSYLESKLTGNDTIFEKQEINSFLKNHILFGIDRSMSDTIILSVKYEGNNPSGLQSVYQKGSNQILAKITYDNNGKLLRIARYYETFAEEENASQYKNCMITLTNQCMIKTVTKPYSIGYAIDGKIVFNHILQGPHTGAVDYQDIAATTKEIKEIVDKNEKGELEAYFNDISRKIDNPVVSKIVAKDFITLFESQNIKHKDFKAIKATLL